MRELRNFKFNMSNCALCGKVTLFIHAFKNISIYYTNSILSKRKCTPNLWQQNLNNQHAHCFELVSQSSKIQILNTLLQIGFKMQECQLAEARYLKIARMSEPLLDNVK